LIDEGLAAVATTAQPPLPEHMPSFLFVSATPQATLATHCCVNVRRPLSAETAASKNGHQRDFQESPSTRLPRMAISMKTNKMTMSMTATIAMNMTTKNGHEHEDQQNDNEHDRNNSHKHDCQ
jgi:hypothetical protein